MRVEDRPKKSAEDLRTWRSRLMKRYYERMMERKREMKKQRKKEGRGE